MSHQASSAEIQWRTLQALQGREGALFKEVRGGLLGDQIATWILLFEDSEPRAAHAFVKQVIAPYASRGGDRFTVGYYLFVEAGLLLLRFLPTTEDILVEDGSLFAVPERIRPNMLSRRKVFASTDSRRP